MATSNTLVILALLMSTASLVVSLVSVWPDCKESLAKFRDAVLWGAFIFVVVGMANYAWRSHSTTPDAKHPPGSPPVEASWGHAYDDPTPAVTVHPSLLKRSRP